MSPSVADGEEILVQGRKSNQMRMKGPIFGDLSVLGECHFCT